jgi:alcohol dehydrogenase (cytochrome c)
MRSNRFGIRIAVSALALAVSCGAQAVTDEDILNDANTPGDIVSYGMGTQGQRFSTIDDLNTDNVRYLQPAWAFSFGSEKMRGQESQPMIKDGVMYVTASYSRAYAIDA